MPERPKQNGPAIDTFDILTYVPKLVHCQIKL